MSQNHRYRSLPTGYRSRNDFCEETGSHYTGQRGAYQTRQDPSPSQSYQPSSRAKEADVSMRPDVLNILNSCGLDPSDLFLLAEMPEDLINIDSLPHLLKKLRESKEQRPALAASTSHFTTSAPAPAYERKRLSSSTDHRSDCLPHPTPASSHRETWHDHGTDQRHTKGISAHHSRQRGTSGIVVEYGHSRHRDSHCDRPAAYSSEPRQSQISASSRHDIDYRQKSRSDDCEPSYLSKKDVHHTLPSKKEASDFHGKTPQDFPYPCHLCNIVVLSDKDWAQHKNAAQHAESQLKLLQRYPQWDCHISSVRREDEHSPGRPAAPDHAKTTKAQKRSIQPMEGPSNKKNRPNLKKVPEKPKNGGKVISVKFAAKSVDEGYLRRLLGQFGAVVKIIMFPTLAFVEMGSKDQAGDIEKYFASNPLEVEGGQVVFSVFEAFKVLKSSKVVCFSPLPAGGGLTNELIAVAKRFGPLKNTKFLPSRAYVEMTNAADAEALVNHHTSKPLRLRGSSIQVDFSSEYETLMNESVDQSPKCSSPERPTRRSHSPRRHHRSKSRSRSPKRRSKDEKDSKERIRSPQHQMDSKEKTQSSQSRSSSSPKEEKAKGKSQDSPPEAVPQKVVKEERVSADADAEGKSEENTQYEASEVHDSDNDLEGVAVIAEDDEMEDWEIFSGMDSKGDEVREKEEDEEQVDFGETGQDGEQEMEEMEILDAVDSDGIEVREEGADEEQVHFRETRQDGEEEMKEVVIQEKIAGEVKPEHTEEQLTSVSRTGLEKLEVCEKAVESEALVASGSEEGDKAQDTAVVSRVKLTDPKSPTQFKKVAEEISEVDEETREPSEDQNENATQDIEDTTREKVQQNKDDGPENMEEVVKEEKDFDFPVDLENLITLDEIDDEDSSEEQDAKEKRALVPDQRVLCIRNLPQRYYTDEDFWKIGKRYGEVTHYFLIRNQCKGFIEMANSDDAKKAVSDLRRKKFVFHGYPLEIALSWKYKKLVHAWVPEPEKKRQHQSSRSKDRSRSRSSSRSRSKQSPTESKDKRSDQSKKSREDSREKSNQKKSISKDSSQKSSGDGKLTVKEESTGKVGTDEEDTTVGQTIKAKPEDTGGLSKYLPNNPVGKEFVRPVVRYFCDLCSVFCGTDEEGMDEHCSSRSHFQKLKEHLEQKKDLNIS